MITNDLDGYFGEVLQQIKKRTYVKIRFSGFFILIFRQNSVLTDRIKAEICRFCPAAFLQDEHGVAVTEESVSLLDRLLIGFHDEIVPAEGTYHDEQTRFR